MPSHSVSSSFSNQKQRLRYFKVSPVTLLLPLMTTPLVITALRLSQNDLMSASVVLASNHFVESKARQNNKNATGMQKTSSQHAKNGRVKHHSNSSAASWRLNHTNSAHTVLVAAVILAVTSQNGRKLQKRVNKGPS